MVQIEYILKYKYIKSALPVHCRELEFDEAFAYWFSSVIYFFCYATENRIRRNTQFDKSSNWSQLQNM